MLINDKVDLLGGAMRVATDLHGFAACRHKQSDSEPLVKKSPLLVGWRKHLFFFFLFFFQMNNTDKQTAVCESVCVGGQQLSPPVALYSPGNSCVVATMFHLLPQCLSGGEREWAQSPHLKWGGLHHFCACWQLCMQS